MRTIKRRPYTGDVVSPEDMRKATDSLGLALTGLGEHNFSSGMASEVTMSDMAAGVAYRVAHAYRGTDTIVQTCLSGHPETSPAASALVFQETDTWKTVWETSWKSTERATYHAMANVQAGHTVGSLTVANAGSADIDTGFVHYDGASLQLAWVLNGDMPAEHVRGSLDTGSSGINMERGFGGQYNAQDVSALFVDVPPGSHTLRLVILRVGPTTGAIVPGLKAYVPMFEAIVWGIHR